LYGFSTRDSCMDSIDFDFLANSDDDDSDLTALWATPNRDPRVVRSIDEVADADARLASQTRGIGELAEEQELDFDIPSLHESELEGLWPTWGERRVASLGRGIPLGLTITPQYIPKGGGESRSISYKGSFGGPASR